MSGPCLVNFVLFAIGAYAAALLDTPLPWTKMRQVYALLGLVKTWGPDRVNAACVRALDAEAINVGLIGRMLERGTETTDIPTEPVPAGPVVTPRFARDHSHFAVQPTLTRLRLVQPRLTLGRPKSARPLPSKQRCSIVFPKRSSRSARPACLSVIVHSVDAGGSCMAER